MESDYDRKYEEMKKYIPFLESMIRRLQNTNTDSINPRPAMLSKIMALKDLLLDRNRRMKLENLLKFEQVLANLYAKSEMKDMLSGIRKAPRSISLSGQEKSPPKGLEAASVQQNQETLLEKARANQTEVDCTPGSKKPALFQWQPSKSSSPTHITTRKNQPSSSGHSNTRVLVSPPPSDCCLTISEEHITPDNHLFHKKSPQKSPNTKELEEPVKALSVVESKGNVDMRIFIPMVSSKNTKTSPSTSNESAPCKPPKPDMNTSINEPSLPCPTDPQKRKNPFLNKDHSNSPQLLNPFETPIPMPNFANMTRSRVPNMTLTRAPNMTSNARTFKVTPSHSLEIDYQSAKSKPVYVSAMWESCDRDTNKTTCSSRQETKTKDETSDHYDKYQQRRDPRPKRAASVGRPLSRESNVSRYIGPDCDIRHERTYIPNKNTSKLSRACSVGGDLAGSWPEKSFKEIKADFNSFKTEEVVPKKSFARGKSVDTSFGGEYAMALKKNIAETVDFEAKKKPIHMINRDPRNSFGNEVAIILEKNIAETETGDSETKKAPIHISSQDPRKSFGRESTLLDQDKFIDITKNFESIITELTKDSVTENISVSLISKDSTNFVSEIILDESFKKQVVSFAEKSSLSVTEVQEQKYMNETKNIYKKIIHQSVSEMSEHSTNTRNENENIEKISSILGKPNEVAQAKQIMLPLPQASKEENNLQTSISDENNSQNPKEILEQSSKENREAYSTPDSTINTESNFSQPILFQEIPDNTISAQTEMNSEISSTHDDTEVPCKDVTTETSSLGETILPESNSLGNISSLLEDKSKIKELLSMLDDQLDNKNLKNKLEKLSEIVSGEQDFAEKCKIVEKEATECEVQLDYKSATITKYPQQEKQKYEKQSESIYINKPENPVDIEKTVGGMVPSKERVDKPNLEKSSKSREEKVDETHRKEDKTSKARWPSWALNNLKVQVNEQKRVTGSESPDQTAQAKRPKKRKCEVQSLQEDVKDMIMSDGVLNETGKRMCRLAKFVDEKKNSESNESSPIKTKESLYRIPVVVLEKFSTKKFELSLPKPTRKNPGSKSKSKPAPEKTLYSKTTEKPIQANRPGPKSKTTVPASQNGDPHEIKENYKKKSRGKKRISKWQMGVISKRTKKNANKAFRRLPVGRNPTPEPIVSTPIKMFPDMNCFTDKNYCFVKSSSTYACRLCEFEGESIVHHYKKHHPHYEIPLSRMHPHTAIEAIKQSMTVNFQDISKLPVKKYVCRFCMMIFDDKRKAILEEFFWHVVITHTGEHKQLCSECFNIKKCTFMLDIPPPPKDLKGLLMGYICGKCNFTQISLENLKNHVSLRHNDEETEVYTISLGVMTQDMVETLKMLAIEESPQTTRNLSLNNSLIIDDKSAPEVEINKKRRPRGPRSIRSKIQFESETRNEQEYTKPVVKREKVAEESKDTQDLVSTLEDPFDDHNIKADSEPDEATPESAASDIDDFARTTMESIQNNSLDVFVESHFKINYTDTGNKEYMCCINGHDHYTTSLMISMKKHVQTKHTFDVWDGYCSVCKAIVMSQGIRKFKDCLAHFLDKHPDNFPVLEKTPEEDVTCPVELIGSESPKTYIQVRPISELIFNQSQSGLTETHQKDTSFLLPKIESVVSLNIDAISNPSVVKKLQENSIAYTNNYDKPAVSPKEIIERNYEEAQKEVISKKHRIVLDMMMTPDKLAHVFKCAGRYCSFTCASTEDALVHASTHQRVGGEDALICSYCSFDAAGNAIDLVSHVFKEHGACQFCCKECFYRAITSTVVEAHYTRMHGVISPGVVLKATIITSFLKKVDESEGLLPHQEAVKHYVCCADTGRCWFKTFVAGCFMQHLSKRHPNVQFYDCNECPYIATRTKDLIKHLRSHGLKLYQCTWCVFGADTEKEMFGHASIKHPMKRPQAYIRRGIQSKDSSSTANFKQLPVVRILKKTAIVPVEVPLGAKPDNPVREAERALELENLLNHTNIKIQNFNFDIASSPTQSRVTVLEEEEELIDIESVPSATRLNDQPTQQTEIICEPPRPVIPTPVDRKLPVSERASPQLKIEATEETPTKETEVAPIRRVSDVIYCLDSDKEDPNQEAEVIDLSDDNDSTTGLSPPVEKTTTTDEGPTQRFSWWQLLKCSKCNRTLKTGNRLKLHYQRCFPNSFDVVSCPYCPYKTNDRNIMINHYSKQHGPLDRYTCGICKHEETSYELITKHFGMVHGLNKLGFKIQLSSQGCAYLVDAVNDTLKTKGRRKRSIFDPPISAPPAKVRRYGPGDVSLLPINQIFDELAQCSLCEFSTKVRKNLIRHVLLHSQQQSVPEIAPVNHINTSSSIAKSTEKSPTPETEPVVAVQIPAQAAVRYPKYIPESQRYACGAKDCSSISIDEAMLKSHWETLHSGSNDYHCVHCPETQQVDTSKPLTAARIIGHLKMHDMTLFACSVCASYHHQEHILDKHLIEKHNGNAQVKVIRGPSTAPPTLVSLQPAAKAPTMDLKPWQCGLCKYKSMLRPEVIDHCSKHHQSKFQYKCAFCPWRSSTLENVTKHHSNSHSEQRADVFYFYYREGSISDEPDGTPRWMKQRLKAGLPVKHEVKTETEPPAPEALMVSTQPPPGVSVDLKIVKREISKPESIKQNQGTIKDLCMKFGNFCDPNGIRYKCSLCKQTMEDTREAMQSHLYEELNYRKWGCSVCSYRAFHIKGLKEHAFHEHGKNLEPVEMSSDKQIETWVTELLDRQENIIKKNLTNVQNQKILTTEKKQLSMSQPKEKETTSMIDKLPAGESSNISNQELTEQLGPFGEPKYLMFCCPKCDDQIKEESKMNEHLEMELSKVRWCCSKCPVKFQNYYQAQLHCRTVHIGQSAKAVDAVRDPKIRSAWIAAVIRAQKLNMNIMPITSVTSAPNKSAPPAEKEPEQEPAENSLLVVRYEENLPNPETSKPQEIHTRRKRPVFMGDVDSDDEDELLVIDEEPEKKTDTVSGIKCPYCECRTSDRSTLSDHILLFCNNYLKSHGE